MSKCRSGSFSLVKDGGIKVRYWSVQNHPQMPANNELGCQPLIAGKWRVLAYDIGAFPAGCLARTGMIHLQALPLPPPQFQRWLQ